MNKSCRSVASLGILTLVAGVASHAQVQTYCTKFGGSISCSSYDHGASTRSYCTSIGSSLSCTTYGDSYSQVQIRQNYEAGQIVGTALGNLIFTAIQEYKDHRRAKQAKRAAWDQFVQDTLGTVQLSCEADPKHDLSVQECRSTILTLNQFLYIHYKDFVPDARNIAMLGDALAALGRTTPVADQQDFSEEWVEKAYRTIDKGQLDKKIYLGLDANRNVW
jgi:hypothetical protein